MSAPASIFTLTAVVSPLDRSSRLWGWYPTRAEAESAVAQNVGNMQDCLYSWLVLERVPAGVMTLAEVVQWYRWDVDRHRWMRTRRPDWARGVVNWGIG